MSAEIGAILAQGGIEVVKLFLSWSFQAARQVGLTEEEIDAMYEKEKAGREARRPEDLPDV